MPSDFSELANFIIRGGPDLEAESEAILKSHGPPIAEFDEPTEDGFQHWGVWRSWSGRAGFLLLRQDRKQRWRWQEYRFISTACFEALKDFES